MRLWTVHPKYLDRLGLVALWRESLLAQAVLKGQTRGYVNHPQLTRFRKSVSPLKSIAFYLQVIFDEAKRRNYCFNAEKFVSIKQVTQIPVTRGQLEYEWIHLKNKLQLRDPLLLKENDKITCTEPHPLFEIYPGLVEEWEAGNKKSPHKL